MLLAEVGRSRSDVKIQVSPRGCYDADMLSRFRDSGVDQVVLPLFARDADDTRRGPATDWICACFGSGEWT